MAYVMPGAKSDTKSEAGPRINWQLGAVVLVGGAVSVFLGVYASTHPPAAQPTFGFSPTQMLAFKSALTTVALVLAVFQLLTALRLRDRIHWPRTAPLWLTDAHRLSGTLALMFSLPVAYHCLWSLGFHFTQAPASNPRVLVHALAGCFFYGVFVTKMLTVRIDSVPRWLVPVVGGAVFGAFVVVWSSSAAYFFTGQVG